MENKFLTVGYITSTRGLKGVLRVKSTSYFAKERYKKGNLVYLYNEKDNTRISVIANTYSTDNKFDYVSFKDLEDINLVEKYIGYAIQVNRDEIPPLKEGTYYYSDLEGLRCISEEGKEFGTIIKVEDFTAQPSFRVKLDKNEKTILIPFVEFYVKKVNLENRTVTIHVIPGLI